MMTGLSQRVIPFSVLFLVSVIHIALSGEVVIQSKVGSRDKFSLQNSTCQTTSGMRICEKFGAQEDGKRCSCICPQNNNTFGMDGETCKCLPNSTLYGGCSKSSQISQAILHRGSNRTLTLPSNNCSLALVNRNNNGSWRTEMNGSEIVALTFLRANNGSFTHSLKVSNSTHFQGILFNAIIQCPNYNSTCFLLKLSSKLECPFEVLLTTTYAPTTFVMTTHHAPPKTDSVALSMGEMAAIIVSCVVFLALVFLVLFLCIRRKRRNKTKQRQEETAENQNDERRSSGVVIFSRPNAAISQRKDSANEGFEPDDGKASIEISDEPNYDLPRDMKHSRIYELFNKMKKPKSVKNSPKRTKSEEKPAKESEDYQIMDSLENPDENDVVYENTRRPSFKIRWKQKPSKKDKNPRGEERSNRNVPKVKITEEKPKNDVKDNKGEEHFYENSEVIKNILRHNDPPRTQDHRNSASYSNYVPDDEEGPPPPPRSTSLDKIIDEPSSTSSHPIPSPRIRAKGRQPQGDNGVKPDKEMENDLSHLYENTRDNIYPKPSPRKKR